MESATDLDFIEQGAGLQDQGEDFLSQLLVDVLRPNPPRGGRLGARSPRALAGALVGTSVQPHVEVTGDVGTTAVAPASATET
jgi:hypothetical protein